MTGTVASFISSVLESRLRLHDVLFKAYFVYIDNECCLWQAQADLNADGVANILDILDLINFVLGKA